MSLRIGCIRVPRASTGDPGSAEGWSKLAGALLAVAPRVSPLGGGAPLGAWVDVSGMERHGGDAAVAKRLLSAAREAGFAGARVGVGGTCVAAALATRERGSAWRVVAEGKDEDFVGRRDLSMLPMSEELRAALELLGLKKCAELGRLPASEVELRFGAEGLWVWRLARGDDSRWPFRPASPERATAEAEMDAPVSEVEPLRFLLRGLISSVLAQLASRQRIPAGLRLALRLDDGGAEIFPIRPARATADERVLMELCRAALESRPLSAPVVGVRLEGVEEGRSRADQLDVFHPPAPDPAAVHAALLPLLARWGDGALSRAAARGAHLPAEAVVWEPAGARGIAELAHRPAPRTPPDTPPRARGALPLQLRRYPQPIPVLVEVDGRDRPDSLLLGARRHPLRAEGPERISGRWWAEPYAREYWLCEDDEGCLRLLFRDGLAGEWREEGWYD
jgi:protein ImuB